jgi:2-phospho-L-lactate guanylyltransferase
MTDAARPADGWTVVLPVKDARRAKSRLGELSAGGPGLARAIALDTIDAVVACRTVAHVVVVTDDEELAASLPLGVAVMTDQAAEGPNAAIAVAMAQLTDAAPRAALLADLPALRSADLDRALAAARGLSRAVVPDAEGTGSTLVTAAPGIAWESAFGGGSFNRHVTLGCAVLAVPQGSSLRRDVDTPWHLARAAELGLGPRTSSWRLASAVADA